MSRREMTRFAPESDPPPVMTYRFSRASICTSESPASPCKSSPNPSPACTPRLLATCPWVSQSTTRVRNPRRASPAPRLTQEVVFATPPFAIVNAIFLNPVPSDTPGPKRPHSHPHVPHDSPYPVPVGPLDG